jgi:prepilin-type N-terminal cleavage/methylation domain-containing protein
MHAGNHISQNGGGTISPAGCRLRDSQPAGLMVPPPLPIGGLVAPKFRRRRNEGGFTFLEVIVALAIFALSGVVLASAYINVLGAQQAALRRDANVADLRLVHQALAVEPALDKVIKWNELELPDDRRGRWKATVTPTTVADLFDVVLEIELTDDKGQSLPPLTENLRMLRPTWSQPADREALRVQARSNLAKRVLP